MVKTAGKTKVKSKTKNAPKAQSKSKTTPKKKTGAKKRSSKKGVVAKIASSIVDTVASVLPSRSKSKGKKKR